LKLLALGVDHHSAPQAVRELLAFDDDQVRAALGEARARFPEVEFALLSTCNRVEFYAASDPELMPTVGEVSRLLADLTVAPLERFASHLVDYHDEEAIEHIFRVASSLESLVVGEGQIQGQVKEAYELAKRCGTTGAILNEVFQQAARVGKLVRESTGMGRGRLSIASVAVDVARNVFDHFSDKTVLVIGLGKMGELTLHHLASLKPGRVLITNRGRDRAEAAAAARGGIAVPFEDLERALVEADLVVSTTAATEPIVSYECYSRVLKARQYRLSLILDIALPRDFDSRINELETVNLYTIDDLTELAESNRRGRLNAVEEASRIVHEQAAGCAQAIRHRKHAGAILRQLGDYSDTVRAKELDRLFASRPHFSEEDREAIALMLHRFQNQLLHHPRSALRKATAEEDGPDASSLIESVKHLFGLHTRDEPTRHHDRRRTSQAQSDRSVSR